MLADQYVPTLLRSVFGDDHGPLFPDTWHLGWAAANGTEITGPGYQRMQVPNDTQTWALAGEVVTNVVDLFGGTPTGTWPILHRVVLFDAFGTVVLSGELTEPVTPVVGEPVILEAGAVVVGVAA